MDDEHHWRFECVQCCHEIGVSRLDDGSIDSIACQTENCLYQGTSYDRLAALRLILDEPSLKSYHDSIRKTLDEAEVYRPRPPFLYRVVPGKAETK